MTDAQAALAQVREALEAGPTPGEWRYVFDDGYRTIVAAETSQSFMCDTEYYPWCPENEADWKLIAACCPPNMSAILAHVEAQAAEIERLTAERNALRDDNAKLNGWVEGEAQAAGRLQRKLNAAEEANERLAAERSALRRQLSEWLRENSPGGWIDELRRQLADAIRERDELRDVLLRRGFVPCDISACNCGSWHHRYGLPERMRDIEDTLSEAGHELSNANGHLPINALKALVAERDDLRRQLAEAELDARRYRWLRGEHKRVDPICAVIWKRNGDRNGSEWVNTANIDAEIDAAMGASNE